MSAEVPHDSPILQSCPDCAAVLDISEEAPLSEVSCPVCGAPMKARTQFNNFTLQAQIGVGGMGVVYRARDTKLNRLVALKVVIKEYSSDPDYHAKFEHEARMAAQVNHPHVVKVYSFGSDHGLFYIAMELVDKGSLDDLITSKKRLPEEQVLDIGIQIAEGLNAACKRGLIHRDVKPGNILFSDEQTSKIVDFGLALPMEHTAGADKKEGEVWGTPYYIAPEKLDHAPEDFRSDIYSLGATLFHALAGRPTFLETTNSIGTLRKLKKQEVGLQSVAPDVSSATAYVINRTLQYDPAKRHQSYDELIEHLKYARTKLEEGGDSQSPTKRLLEEDSPKKVIAKLVSMAVLLVVLIGGLLFVFRGGKPAKEQRAADTASAVPAPAGSDAAEKYRVGRKQLLRGDYAAAQTTFYDLAATQDLPHPLDRWVILHNGLSAFLAGNTGEGRAAFGKLQQGGLFSTAPEERNLAKFFVDVGEAVSAGKPITAATLGDQYDPGNCGALGLLIFALADWQQSHFDEANGLFQAFIAADPKPPYDWIADYKPIAQKYVTDFDAFQKTAAEVKAADTLQKETDALKNVQDLEGRIHFAGLKDQLARMETELNGKIAAAQAEEQERAAREARERERQSKLLTDAQAKFRASLHGYHFEEGLAALEKAPVTDPQVSQEKEALVKKARWLAKFKETLINDMNTVGYLQPVYKLNSAPMGGGVRKASGDHIEIQTPYGAVLIPWEELPAPEILAMSDYFTKRVTVPDLAADRKWMSGVFAMEMGMTAEGSNRLNQVAEAKADYHDLLPLFSKP